MSRVLNLISAMAFVALNLQGVPSVFDGIDPAIDDEVEATTDGKVLNLEDTRRWTSPGSNYGGSGTDPSSPFAIAEAALSNELERLRIENREEFLALLQETYCSDTTSPIVCDSLPPAPADPAAPPVTYPTTIYAADLASFVPNAPTITGEPQNIGLIGKATNIVASAEEHVQSGTLFGYPVFADFVPSSYTFDYGDGTSITTDTGGTTWASQGLAQFSDAPTAHAYAARGEYTATVTTNYTAYVAFPDGVWREVVGTVASSATYPVQIYTAKTALVNDDCIENPSGVGCR